jgi:hypothetical protein
LHLGVGCSFMAEKMILGIYYPTLQSFRSRIKNGILDGIIEI